ncbi:conserved hypothetical protein [Nitrosococcus oceani ATCC 19707]|uniref:BioF2-like acetyltransferase domain-containing protein n=2 Tax=Nitrosococcus oceani TaxID=1229 RepID=Q3J737_NITOC|nr:GNAT family N-acetyltransferase [Nitrosococcus oceani]ABA59359.1 conserved hypothetical protein [Nitrosococcus oceani ATCC 19707]EDZ65539.1 hypothetical protein NOC27_2219 [Nitrosococcus oceani AFC27]KFI18244.1 acetyltransferase [Nitrosococcus oceani C-27]GEM20072.1 acetyltransferase [Nitrosococcus oceani]
MKGWKLRQVPFKYQLSDRTLWSASLPLQCRSVDLFDESLPQLPLEPPADELVEGSQGFSVRALPVGTELPRISRHGSYLCYVPLNYQHYYIDLSLTYDDYQKTFSSKTRSTINRKVKKYAKHCGGNIRWKTYKAPGEIGDFFRQARRVSKLTYQERLLDAGIPGSDAFIQQAEALAGEDRLRAYILFDGERPVSYLYCPARNDVLIYAYLGYDPDYMKLSVGTVLQWLALQELFGEGRFKIFDFTEGQSDHKRLFATHQKNCANVFFVKNSIRNGAIIYSHNFSSCVSGWLGSRLDQLGLKARIKRLLRFAG